MRNAVNTTALAVAILIEALLSRPHTAEELAEKTGWRRLTVYAYLRSLHAKKAVHIAYWLPDSMGRDKTKVWTMGYGIDAKRRKTDKRRLGALQREKATACHG